MGGRGTYGVYYGFTSFPRFSGPKNTDFAKKPPCSDFFGKKMVLGRLSSGFLNFSTRAGAIS
jgi:hypothetical protein